MRLLGFKDQPLVQARDMIDRQVTHMARLIDDLLDMSRLSRGKILLRKERLDLVQEQSDVPPGSGLRESVLLQQSYIPPAARQLVSDRAARDSSAHHHEFADARQ